MYKSSIFTFIYKYLFTPILCVGFLIGIIPAWSSTDPFVHDWSRGAAIMLAYFVVWMLIMMIRLKSVEAKEDCLVIKTLQSQKNINYSDIEWVSEILMVNPRLISIKYKDRESGVSRKILAMTGRRSIMEKIKILGEHEMTGFIRSKIMAANPSYSKEMEPSRWLPVGLIFLTAIPVLIIVKLYFFKFI